MNRRHINKRKQTNLNIGHAANIIGLKRNTPNAKHPAKHCSWRGVAI